MILYEYPFNERIRTYLRLAHLFDRLRQLISRDAAVDHHFALVTIFEIMEVAGRADLKSEILKDLERQKALMNTFRGNPSVSEASLETILAHLQQAFDQLSQQPGRPGHKLTENDWLMGVRSRAAIPGGTCEFDLPSYHAWQQRDASARRSDLRQWASTLGPIAQATGLLLQILRNTGKPQMMVAPGGHFHAPLPQNRPVQMLRLRLDEELRLVPEISGNRLAVSVRLLEYTAAGKMQTASSDAPFELALCS